MAQGPELLSEEMKEDLKRAASLGVTKLKEYLQKKSDEWRKIPLNIGITGEGGVGKSSFINALRGLTAEDEGGAHVDVVEATIEIQDYKHPKNESLILWDLPGVGTPEFPRSTYLSAVQFDRYDFFLILSAGRFRDDDLWLAQEIRRQNKNFHFVRTQMDVDVEKNKKSHPKTHQREKVIDKVRNNCLEKLEKYDLTNASVFLIDNYSTRDFDFDHLATTLIDEAPAHKRDAMILSMSVLLEKKVEALRNRIFKISLLSAIGGAVPIPGVSAVIDGALMLSEVSFYKAQLGLDPETMKKNARLLNTEVEVLQKKLGLQSVALANTAKGLVQAASSVAVSEAIESALPIAIPLIGSILSAGLSYGVSVASLRYLLKMCAKDARKINKELMKNAII